MKRSLALLIDSEQLSRQQLLAEAFLNPYWKPVIFYLLLILFLRVIFSGSVRQERAPCCERGPWRAIYSGLGCHRPLQGKMFVLDASPLCQGREPMSRPPCISLPVFWSVWPGLPLPPPPQIPIPSPSLTSGSPG